MTKVKDPKTVEKYKDLPFNTAFTMYQQSSYSVNSSDIAMAALSSRTRGHRHNLEQKLFLVDFMEAHPEFAFGRHAGPRQKAQALWIQLTEEMNARGPKKTVAQWQKAWTDVKSRAKSRVMTKSNNPKFDPINDLDSRVLALLESVVESSTATSSTSSNRLGYTACDVEANETDVSTKDSSFFHSFEDEVLPPEMVFLPETETEPESMESCSIRNVKDEPTPENHVNDSNATLDDRRVDEEHLGDEQLEDGYLNNQNSLYGTADAQQSFDQNGSVDDVIEVEQNFNENNTFSTKYTHQNYYQKHNLSSIRNRWRKLPNRSAATRHNMSPSVSITQRRQVETLEVISKAMLQNAENEKKRNSLMTQSLEINKARLKAEIERNDLLRDLVSTLKGISQNKNQLFH